MIDILKLYYYFEKLRRIAMSETSTRSENMLDVTSSSLMSSIIEKGGDIQDI